LARIGAIEERGRRDAWQDKSDGVRIKFEFRSMSHIVLAGAAGERLMVFGLNWFELL
jgi:hypothetical protein